MYLAYFLDLLVFSRINVIDDRYSLNATAFVRRMKFILHSFVLGFALEAFLFN